MKQGIELTDTELQEHIAVRRLLGELSDADLCDFIRQTLSAYRRAMQEAEAKLRRSYAKGRAQRDQDEEITCD